MDQHPGAQLTEPSFSDTKVGRGEGGDETGKPLLEEPGGQAIGHSQVIQVLCRPLVQFEEQGRQVLPGSDDLFQQADGLEEAGEPRTGRGGQGQGPPRARHSGLQTEREQQDRLSGLFPRFSKQRSTSEPRAHPEFTGPCERALLSMQKSHAA